MQEKEIVHNDGNEIRNVLSNQQEIFQLLGGRSFTQHKDQVERGKKQINREGMGRRACWRKQLESFSMRWQRYWESSEETIGRKEERDETSIDAQWILK